MRVCAYLRVSSDTQDTNHQRLAILDYAQRARFQIDEFIEVEMSSRRSPVDRKLDLLASTLATGDMLIVSELSRLGRSLGEVVTLVDQLYKRRVRFVAVKEKIDLSDNYDMGTKVTVTLFSLFAELERDLNSMRTKEALAALKKDGKTLGRPSGVTGRSRLDGKESEINKLLGMKVSKSSVAKIMAVHRSTLENFIRSRKLVPRIN